jgi:hypothetical protein
MAMAMPLRERRGPILRPRTVLLTFAFATERHAAQALATLRSRADLLVSVRQPDPSPSPTDLALVDLEVRPGDRDPVVTLAIGLHGILVRDESSAAKVA